MKSQTDVKSIVEGFLKYLEKENCVNLLPEIVKLLTAQAKDGSDGVIRVVSAYELTTAKKNALSNLLTKKYSLTNVEYEIDERVLGGLKIYAGDLLLDLTTKGKIQELTYVSA